MGRHADKRITLVAGQGDMGGGEHMLLRIGEAAHSLGWTVSVIGPTWGNLRAACEERDFAYKACSGTNRRSYALSAAAHLSRHTLGLVWANGALPALAATATPNPLVVHLHQRPSRAQQAPIRLARARARVVLVPSRSMQSVVSGSQVMLNWTEEIQPIPRSTLAGVYTVGYLGRLSVDKGVDTLVDTVNRLADEHPNERVRLLLAGDSRFVPADSISRIRSALDSCAAQVVELGWVNPREVFATSDVVVVPSRWQEPFGLVAAEAMAAECPLVVSDAGGLPEVVGHDHPWTFRAGDAHALYSVLRQLRDGKDPNSHALRRRWEVSFSPEAGRQRLERVLESDSLRPVYGKA